MNATTTLAACLSAYATMVALGCLSSGTLVKHDDYDRFGEGRTTRTEVRRAVGNPNVKYTDNLTSNACEAYEYVTDDFAKSKRVDFCYDPQGVLVSKRCVSGGGGCNR